MSKLTEMLQKAGIKPDGYYYLHTNGDLIYKPAICLETDPDYFVSDFVRETWAFVTDRRECAWTILIEASVLGANEDRIKELKEKWGCTDEDAPKYAERMGLKIFLDGNQWCAAFDDFVNVQESQVGTGKTALEAFINLARQGKL